MSPAGSFDGAGTHRGGDSFGSGKHVEHPLYPGYIAMPGFFAMEIPVWALFLPTLVAGFGGALRPRFIPTSLFDRMVLWLSVAGAYAFVFAAGDRRAQRHFRPNVMFLLLVPLIPGVYGGYCGNAVGILTTTVWSVLGLG